MAPIKAAFLLAVPLFEAMRLKKRMASRVTQADEVSLQRCENLVPVTPRENLVHLLSSTYRCDDGILPGPWSTADSNLSCRGTCGEMPECFFASIWMEEGKQYCLLTSGCRTKQHVNLGVGTLTQFVVTQHAWVDVYGKRYLPRGAVGDETYVWSSSVSELVHLPAHWVKGQVTNIHNLGCAKVQGVAEGHAFETMVGPKPEWQNTYAVSDLQPSPVDSCELGPWEVLQGIETYHEGDQLEVFFDGSKDNERKWQGAVFKRLCGDNEVGVEYADEDPPGVHCLIPAYVKKVGNYTHFESPRDIDTCKRWCTENVHCMAFRAAYDAELGLVSCESIDKNGCFDPESARWGAWPDKTADWNNFRLRRARVQAIHGIDYDEQLAMNGELMFGGDPFHSVSWKFHWKSDPMNLVTNDVASSGRNPPCLAPLVEHTEGSIYPVHYKCKLENTVAFRGDHRDYAPRTIILNRDGTFDSNLNYLDALKGGWEHLIRNEHLANEVLNLVLDDMKDQIIPIKDWFETYVVVKFLGFVSHVAAHGSAPYILAKTGLGLLGVKAALAKFVLPVMIAFTVTSYVLEVERRMDETDDRIKFIGCNSKRTIRHLTPHISAQIDDNLHRCDQFVPGFFEEFQRQVSAIIEAQMEIFRRFERISECVLSWGWEPEPGTLPVIWKPGRARGGTVDCLSNVLLPGLMGINGRPGLLHATLSLVFSWWQQHWGVLKRRDQVHRNVHEHVNRIWALGMPAQVDGPALWVLPEDEAERKGVCFGLASTQAAFVDVFDRLAVTATYWVQTFGLYPSNGTFMANALHSAMGSRVKCEGIFREYPSFAKPGQVLKPWKFCPAARHQNSGNVDRFCDGNIWKFGNEISRAAAFS